MHAALTMPVLKTFDEKLFLSQKQSMSVIGDTNTDRMFSLYSKNTCSHSISPQEKNSAEDLVVELSVHIFLILILQSRT